jgi:hypothetical protein
VAKTEALLGELRSQRVYRSYDVFLAEDLFEADFALALAVFVHEHAHIFGYDGSRVFTDELTGLLESVVRARESLGRWEKAWHAVRQAVLTERRQQPGSEGEDIHRSVALLCESELRELVERLPPALLRQLLKKPAQP